MCVAIHSQKLSEDLVWCLVKKNPLFSHLIVLTLLFAELICFKCFKTMLQSHLSYSCLYMSSATIIVPGLLKSGNFKLV